MFENLPENITSFLRRRKKTKRELSEYLDIHPGSLNRALRSKNVTLDRLSKIADFLGMEFFELLESLDYTSESNKAYSTNKGGSHRINDPDFNNLKSVLSEIVEKQQIITQNFNEIDKKIALIEKILLNL